MSKYDYFGLGPLGRLDETQSSSSPKVLGYVKKLLHVYDGHAYLNVQIRSQEVTEK